MEGLLTGIIGLLTFVLLGLLAGAGVGVVWDVVGVLAIVGALSGGVGFVVRDRLRARRLLNGLQDTADPRFEEVVQLQAELQHIIMFGQMG